MSFYEKLFMCVYVFYCLWEVYMRSGCLACAQTHLIRKYKLYFEKSLNSGDEAHTSLDLIYIFH